MNWQNQQYWLAVLAGSVALGLPISVASCESLPQTVSQNQAQGASPGVQQSVPAMPATMAAEPPGAVQVPAPAGAQAPLRSLSPEEQGDVLMAQQRYQAGIEAYKKVAQRSADVWNKMGIGYHNLLCHRPTLRKAIQHQ